MELLNGQKTIIREWKLFVNRAPKYDLVVLSRTEYEVVLGRTEYKYDRKNVNLVRGTTQYKVRLSTRYDLPWGMYDQVRGTT